MDGCHIGGREHMGLRLILRCLLLPLLEEMLLLLLLMLLVLSGKKILNSCSTIHKILSSPLSIQGENCHSILSSPPCQINVEREEKWQRNDEQGIDHSKTLGANEQVK